MAIRATTKIPGTKAASARRAKAAPASRTGALPIHAPFPVMDALAATALPEGAQWQYEPKWDGFRCLAFRSGESVELQSKGGQPLERYFPELVEAFRSVRASQFVMDGEIVIPVGQELSFQDLLMRIHPAESRIRRLAAETPALFLAFDMLVDSQGELLIKRPLSERRSRLEAFFSKAAPHGSPIRLSPATNDFAKARQWFQMMVGLDGVIAKRQDALYEAGQRSGAMLKIKRVRTADCVVGGFRYASKGKWVGSLLLGLYDSDGLLQHVGFTSSIAASERAALTRKLQALKKPPGFTGKAPGGPSRWSTSRSTEWEPLAPVLVVEVQFDHFTGGRFRHGTRLLRWRPDTNPRQCTMKQVQSESRSSLKLL